MKLIVIAAATALAFPAFAQNTTLPDSKDRAQNRDKVEQKVDSAKDKLPSANERAQNRDKVNEKLPTADKRSDNREKVSKGASNATLTGKVKSALASDQGMKTLGKIDVDSAEGVVTLKGRVDTADAKKRAEEIAKKVEGVKSVKNQLRVEAAKKG